MSHMKIKRGRGIFYVGFLVVFLFTLVTATLAPFVQKAQAVTPSDPLAQYTAYQALYECRNKLGVNGTGNSIQYLYINNYFNITVPLDTPSLAGDQGDGNGFAPCDTFAPKAMTILGLTESEYYAAIGYQDKLVQAGATQNTYWYYQGNTSISKNITDAQLADSKSRFKTAMANKGIPTTMTDAMRMTSARAALESTACGAKITPKDQISSSLWASYPNFSNTTLNSQFQKIRWVDLQGKMVESVIEFPDTGKLSAQVGVYPDRPMSGKDMDRSRCGDVVADFNKLASGWVQTYVKEATTKATAAYTDALTKQYCQSSTPDVYAACAMDIKKVVQACISKLTFTAVDDVNSMDLAALATCVSSSGSKYIPATDKDKVQQILEAAKGAAQSSLAPTQSGSTSNPDPCEAMPADVAMRWLACSVLTTISGILDIVYSMVMQLLYTPNEIFATGGLTKVAAIFRNLGIGLLIIAGLIMIIAEASSLDIIDAYTVRKVLPKIGIALVGVALIVPVTQAAVTLTNDLGVAMGDFVKGLAVTNSGGVAATAGEKVVGVFGAAFTGLLGTAGGILALFAYGWSSISFLGTALLGIMIALVVVAIRQLVIIVLIMLAPIAVAASVLPGTEKFWKFWKNTFITTLAMFPIISLMLGSGYFLAGIFSQMPGLGEPMKTFMVLTAFIAPYFMVPMAFKMAGGLMGNIFGMVNDRSKGMFDRMSKWRQNTRKRRVADYVSGAKEGPKLPNTMFGKSLKSWAGRDLVGDTISRGALVYEGGLNPFGKGRDRFNKHRTKLRKDAAYKALQEDAGFAFGNTDATNIAKDSTGSADFVDRYVAATATSKYGGDMARARQGAYRAIAELEASAGGAKIGSRRMQTMAARAIATDNTANFDEPNNEANNQKNIEDHYGTIAQQIDLDNISEGDAIGLSGENKMRPDVTGFSTGTRLKILGWVRQNAREGRGYTLTSDQAQELMREQTASINSSSAVHANPRAAKGLSESLGTTVNNVLKGGPVASDPATARLADDAIAQLEQAEYARMTDVEKEPPTEETRAVARKNAQAKYKKQVAFQELAKVVGINDTMGQGLPEVQSIFSSRLMSKEISAGDIDASLHKDLGITQADIDAGRIYTYIDLANQARNNGALTALRHDYGTGAAADAAARAGEKPDPTRSPDPQQAGF